MFSGLNQRERAFVVHLMRGEPHEIAAKFAGYRQRLASTDLLGRPHVREAVQRLAPLCPPAIAVSMLRPYVLMALASRAVDPNARDGVSAARDLLALGDASAKPSAIAAWDQRQAARGNAKPSREVQPSSPTEATPAKGAMGGPGPLSN